MGLMFWVFSSGSLFSDILCFVYLSVGCSTGRCVIPCDSHSFVFWMLSSVGCVIVFCVSFIALFSVCCCSSLDSAQQMNQKSQIPFSENP